MITNMSDFKYYDLRKRAASRQIDLLFPNWQPGSERVAIFSPHDDDALLGAGYLILAALANGADVFVYIFCDGSAGYSKPEDKDNIVSIRQAETLAAYNAIEVPAERIIRFDFPDFSLLPYIGRKLPGGKTGTFEKVLRSLRKNQITRLVIPNAYREHIDHEATSRIGAYDAPQVGDRVLADWGAGLPIHTILTYAVWGDFNPEDALIHSAPSDLRANRAIAASRRVERAIEDGLRYFKSQGEILAGLLAGRGQREQDGRCLELYLDFNPRPPLDYAPYHKLVEKIDKE